MAAEGDCAGGRFDVLLHSIAGRRAGGRGATSDVVATTGDEGPSCDIMISLLFFHSVILSFYWIVLLLYC